MSKIDFPLHPKQWRAYTSRATEILYGGSAGAAKSHLMRVCAIMWCLFIPGLQVYLFRRLYDDLIKNHMEGPTGFHAMLAPWVGRWVEIVDAEIRFNNGSKIYLCHCQHEKDRIKYQGAEIHVLLIDELTHFTETIYRFLRSRVRMPKTIQLSAEFVGQFPRILCGSNPGGVGHQWVKSTWIDPKEIFEIWRTPPEEGGFLRQFIPANLNDNPSLDQATYKSNLMGLGNEALVRAMLDGDWDIVAGAALEVTKERHLLRPFKILKHWTKFMVIDWGYVKPYSVGWYAVPDEDIVLAAKGDYQEKFIPKKSLIRYRELYGSDGKPNEGLREESPIVAERIIKIEREADERMDFRVGDAAMWAKNDGTSIAERMQLAGIMLQPSKKDRQAGYNEITARLRGEQFQDEGFVPMLFVTANCTHWWRTVPPLISDDLKPESGPDSNQEDHCYDDMQYACMSRPYTVTKVQRIESIFKKGRRLMNTEKVDPYRIKPVAKRRN